ADHRRLLELLLVARRRRRIGALRFLGRGPFRLRLVRDRRERSRSLRLYRRRADRNFRPAFRRRHALRPVDPAFDDAALAQGDEVSLAAHEEARAPERMLEPLSAQRLDIHPDLESIDADPLAHRGDLSARGRSALQNPRFASRSSTSFWLDTTSAARFGSTTGPDRGSEAACPGACAPEVPGGVTWTSSRTRLSSSSVASETTFETTCPVRSWKSCAIMISVRCRSTRALASCTSLANPSTAPLATARTGSARMALERSRADPARRSCSSFARSTQLSTLSAASPVLREM